MKEAQLVDLFRRLGARNPEGWAHSQVTEDLPQLARFLFLRQAWTLVVSEKDRTWVKEALKQSEGSPGGAISPALERLLATGVSEDDLSTVVRVMQWRVLSGFCRLLEDPGCLEDDVDEIAWRLFQVDENDQPIAVMGGMQESVLETEPTGNEMRSR